MKNTLYFGDNLAIMRKHIADESVDLIYLDPPFNSARDYNVLFKEAKKAENEAQVVAFTDTWNFHNRILEEFFDDSRNAKLFDLTNAVHHFLGASEMMAYLLMMGPRLLEMQRVLKPTGSLYLHCDPVASHYLKIMLDVVFGPGNFRNEITWKRADAHNDARHQFAKISDTLLFYAKAAPSHHFNVQYGAYPEKTLQDWYLWLELADGSVRRMTKEERDTQEIPAGARRFNTDNLRSPNPRPNLTYEYKGYKPHRNGWAVSKAKMAELDEKGLLLFPADLDGRIMRKKYLDEQEGVVAGDIWTDISQLRGTDAERMGYPTQKPLALLERIIKASSKPGDVVLDPFCGCGTAIAAAEKLGRKWIGIDVTFIAIDLMVKRMKEHFELERDKDYDVLGDPYDAHSAGKLFQQSPKEFEMWAVRKVGGVPQPDKSGDKGVDGRVYFGDENKEHQYAVCQVKGGHLTPSVIRDFAHVIQRENAAMGFFICLGKPTKGMYQEAGEIGFFDSPSGRKIPKLQIRTIKELLDGKEFDYPRGWVLRSGGKKLTREADQGRLDM